MNALLRSLFSAALLVSAIGAFAQASDYPRKPITLVVPFAAASGTDAVGRLVAQKLGERLGQSVVVDNRAGANGQIGVEYVSKAAPDGYTLLMSTATTLSINPGLYKNLRFNAERDFTPIARTGVMPSALAVRADFPARTLAEMADAARRSPKGLSFAASNSGAWLTGVTLRSALSANLVDIQYKSAQQALVDLLGGQVDLYVVDFATSLPGLRAGQLRALGVASAKRSALMPDVPAIAETVPGFDLAAWNGILGPAGMPTPVVDKLAREIKIVMDAPDTREKLATLGFEVWPTSSAGEFAKYVADERAKWSASIKQSGIEMQ